MLLLNNGQEYFSATPQRVEQTVHPSNKSVVMTTFILGQEAYTFYKQFNQLDIVSGRFTLYGDVYLIENWTYLGYARSPLLLERNQYAIMFISEAK